MAKIIGLFTAFKGKLGKWFWVVLLVALFVIWRIVAGATKTVAVEATSVTEGDIVESVATSGTIRADNYANLTFQSSGKVAKVYVKIGDEVKKGDWIASLDAVSLNATYQEALNAYRKYQATADNILDQVKDHSTDETLTQRDTRTTAEVNRDSAYDAVKAAENALANATLKAPFNGIVAQALPSFAGSNVTITTSSYIIVDPSTVYFDAEVEETDLPNVAVGQKVNIKLDAYPGETFVGEVTNIGFVAFTSATGGNAYSVRVSMPENGDMKFRYGMKGDIDIIYNTTQSVVKVSTLAIVGDGDTNYVWKIEGGRIKKTEVSLGGESTDEIEVKSGVLVGDVVVANPGALLKDGQKVNTTN